MHSFSQSNLFGRRRLLHLGALLVLLVALLGTTYPAHTQSGVLLHYWNFNNPADILAATSTLGGATFAINLEGTAAFLADTGQSFWGENARNGDATGSHLRVNNPLGAILTFKLPTTGYKNIVIQYETRRSGQGAGLQEVSYTTDGSTYQVFQTITTLDAAPVLQVLDFSAIPSVNENTQFGIQIRFLTGAGSTAGNNRFDNFTVEGSITGMPQVAQPVEFLERVEDGASSLIDLNQVFHDPDHDPLMFTASSDKPNIATVALNSDDGMLAIQPKQRGDTWITLSANDGTHPTVSTRFRVLVYPRAYNLVNGFYAFTEWNPELPEYAYPPNGFFLQSNLDDPGYKAPLVYPYYIPPEEYSIEDIANIGFPYKNTKRTRINGLGKEGISFINTGRGRDLGGFLVAVNARNVTAGYIDWLGGTVLFNERAYAIRLQYRIGFTGEFQDILVGGRPVEYIRNSLPGHTQNFSQIPIPTDVYGREYVQFLWRYYYISGSSGTRAQLRLDNVLISQQAGPLLLIEKQGVGLGTITSSPAAIQCGSACIAQFSLGTEVTLQAVAERFSAFVGWTGVCAGQGSTCTFKVTQSNTVAAIFERTEGVVINEFMSSNGTVFTDEDGDYSDWIELYNRGLTPVSIGGYGLSDSSNLFKWVFPDVTLGPGEFLRVWASGKNRAVAGQPLHTNFSISAGGEVLSLTHPTTGTISKVGPVVVPRDMSYGLYPDGSYEWYFFDQTTPAGSNNPATPYREILPPPTFSQAGGFYTESFPLTLSMTDPEVTILYTLDGSIPDPANLNGTTYFYKNQYPLAPGDPFGEKISASYRSYVYSQPVPIYDRSSEPDKLAQISTTFDRTPTYFPAAPVFKGTTVRARAIKKYAYPSPIQSQTFFVTPQAEDRYSLPVVSLSIPEEALFDYEDGIYVAGVDFDTWRAANPDAPISLWTPANYTRKGDAWEIPTTLELFETTAAPAVLNQAIGVRIQGSTSRVAPRKSLRLYARSDYGASYINYPIFPGASNTDYKRLLLRNSGQDESVTNFRDALIQAVVSNLRFDTQAYRPAIVFINGEYWGIHNIRENYDKYYLNQKYGVDPENIDYLKNFSEVEEGDTQHYDAMIDYIRTYGVQTAEHYQHIQTLMDVDNFIDYQIANIFAANQDWPANNVEMWRLRSAYNPLSPYGQDGRWRWLLYDTDYGFNLRPMDTPADNTLKTVATIAGSTEWPNPDWATFLFRSLLENETFRANFVTRFADLLNTNFKSERMTDLIAEFKAAIAPEMPEHIARWNRPASMDVWDQNVAVLVNFANQRPDYQRQHIREYFGIESDAPVTVDVSDPRKGYIHVNTIDITGNTPSLPANPYPWTGSYFKGVAVQVTAVPRPGYQFVGWKERPDEKTPTLKVWPEDGLTLTAIFEARVYLPILTGPVAPER